MEKITLTCPKCHNRFREQKKIAPELSDPIDIDLLMYTCPICHWRFLQNPRSKLQSIECTVDGIKFQSRLEARRYTQLKQMEQEGVIRNLVLQPKFLLQERFKDPYSGKVYQPIRYIGDFMYTDQTGHKIVEDTKGFATDTFRLKFKLVIYKYPEIRFVLLKGKDF
jgi:predicted nucleic-acid-binding Zn-ribbon protein